MSSSSFQSFSYWILLNLREMTFCDKHLDTQFDRDH